MNDLKYPKKLISWLFDIFKDSKYCYPKKTYNLPMKQAAAMAHRAPRHFFILQISEKHHRKIFVYSSISCLTSGWVSSFVITQEFVRRGISLSLSFICVIWQKCASCDFTLGAKLSEMSWNQTKASVVTTNGHRGRWCARQRGPSSTSTTL